MSKINSSDIIFNAYKITMECPHCANNTPFNDLSKKQKCQYCSKTFNSSEIIERLKDIEINKQKDNVGLLGSVNANLESKKIDYPKCFNCSVNLKEADQIKPGDSIICQNCNKKNPTAEPPEWLTKRLKNDDVHEQVKYKATAVFYKDKVVSEVEAELKQEGGKAIIFACQGCSANLKIDRNTPRVLTCEYCKADQYLPDDLWKAIHPVPIIREICIKWEKLD